jgi:CubicO group peptidase (beta-lactamase class C family)
LLLTTGSADSPLAGGRPIEIGEIVRHKIAANPARGEVVLVGSHGRNVYGAALGALSVVPARMPILPYTIFELTSLTGVIAPAVTRLVKAGRIRLNDPVR